jgi:hypothetical protein
VLSANKKNGYDDAEAEVVEILRDGARTGALNEVGEDGRAGGKQSDSLEDRCSH